MLLGNCRQQWRKVITLPPLEAHMKNVEVVNLRRYFKHYRTGVVYDAYDYGHKAWPIGKSTKR